MPCPAWRPALAIAAVLATTACSTTPADRDVATTRAQATERLGLPAPADDNAAQVTQRLAAELGRDDAAVIALLNAPAQRRAKAELHRALAARIAATRPPNPGFSFGRMSRGAERETERGVHIDLVGLVSWPFAAGSARRDYEAAKLDSLRSALQLAQAARIAWTDAVAAGAQATHAKLVRDAAEAGLLYAQRLADTGNASRLQEARALAFRAEAEAALLRTNAAAVAAREQLAQVLGVADSSRLQLPGELPPAPATPRTRPDAEQAALDNRLDVQAAQAHAAATARHFRLQRVTRFVNVLELGYANNTSNSEPRQTGWEVSLELPLFDFGQARGSEARARYEAALATVAEVAIAATTQARSAWVDYDSAWRAAQLYRDTVLPQQARITRELLLRWNGMLVGPFELLDQAREQAAANTRAQAALRDFWLADAALDAVLNGAGMAMPVATPQAAPASAGGH